VSSVANQWRRLSAEEVSEDALLPCLRRGAWLAALLRLTQVFLNICRYFFLAGLICFGASYAIPPGLPFSLVTSHGQDLPTFDFSSWIASGQAAKAGGNPYLVYPLTYMVRVGNTYVPAPNLNPPISVLVFQSIADAPLDLTFRAWHLISFILFLASVMLLVSSYPRFATRRRLLWTFALTGLWSTLQQGQIYMPMLLAVAGAWLLLQRQNQFAAGILIGVVVAIKPNFLVWPGLLFIGGYATAALSACVTAALLSAWPALVYGPLIYVEWLKVSTSFPGIIYAGNGSLISLAGRLGMEKVGVIMSVLLLVAIGALVWRYRPTVLPLSSLAIVAALLTSPITWVGYTIFLLPWLFSRPWNTWLRIAATLLLVPFPIVYALFDGAFWQQIVFGSFWLWALLILLVVCVNDVRRARRSSFAVS